MSFISSWGIESRYCCVVSEAGEYLTFVLVQKIAHPETEEKTDQIQNYKLKDGEQLVESMPPIMRPYAGAAGFIKPRWDSIAWIEAASAEEIAAWEAEHPAPEVPEPEPSGDYVTYGELAKAIREGVNAV